MAKLSFMEKLRKLFGIKSKYDEEFFEELGDTLIESDIGAKLAFDIVDQLEEECKKEKIFDENLIVQKLKELLSPCVLQTRLEPAKDKVNVYLVLGVNGVGKTTSVAKMAGWYAEKYFGSKDDVIMAASDTFRAAAIDQLKVLGKSIQIDVFERGTQSPTKTVKEAIAYAEKFALDYVIVHELSHFIYPNHSKDFWTLVGKYYPKYKEVRKYLRTSV